ncbi:hypothetical protein LXA43DRAFT_126309 [Ganoderma leucocontextum]|nr:hypothetical protein LXA43DRAFT_126309 [Ganoderma leucocontextum]
MLFFVLLHGRWRGRRRDRHPSGRGRREIPSPWSRGRPKLLLGLSGLSLRDFRRRSCRARRRRWGRKLTNLLEVLRLLRDFVCVSDLTIVCVLVLLTLLLSMVVIGLVSRTTWLPFFVLITFLDGFFMQFMGMCRRSRSTCIGNVRLL